MDGNKRVAFSATAIFLRMSGYRLSVSANDGEAFILDHVIRRRIEVDDIATWLDSRMERPG